MRWLLLALCAVACRGEVQESPRTARSTSPSASPVAAPSSAIGAQPSAPDAASDAPNQDVDLTQRAHAPRYPFGAIHSPIDARQVAVWEAHVAAHPGLREDRFMKVGDSITASGDSLFCIGRPQTLKALEAARPTSQPSVHPSKQAPLLHSALDPALHQAALHFGAGGPYGGSFGRTSAAAVVGWSAHSALFGGLRQEQQALRARYALIQFGTNDIEVGAIHHFADKLFDVVEQVHRAGALPVLYTIPSRADRARSAAEVPRYNAVIRGLAQAFEAPLVDLHLALSALPRRGLTGDGIHPTTYSGPAGRAPCDFSPQGLEAGYNRRNHLTLEVLARLLAARAGKLGEARRQAEWSGDGTNSTPYEPPGWPLIDFSARAAELPAGPCGGAARGVSYRLRLTERARVELLGFDRRVARDVVLSSEAEPQRCLGSDARRLRLELPAGSYRVELREVKASPEEAPGSRSALEVGSLLVARIDGE
ncbi:MAG: SGNH/GDSL hydrolase family protein [Polyangiaceae bacterium]|nr:SGNH/GDSL hydrolase family protein [Polyangiaceae bacterium]MCW5789836.1 SGNH/GDSL hydrolase family protein [Polyangiaceae bacterium]